MLRTGLHCELRVQRPVPSPCGRGSSSRTKTKRSVGHPLCYPHPDRRSSMAFVCGCGCVAVSTCRRGCSCVASQGEGAHGRRGVWRTNGAPPHGSRRRDRKARRAGSCHVCSPYLMPPSLCVWHCESDSRSSVPCVLAGRTTEGSHWRLVGEVASCCVRGVWMSAVAAQLPPVLTPWRHQHRERADRLDREVQALRRAASMVGPNLEYLKNVVVSAATQLVRAACEAQRCRACTASVHVL